MVPEADLIARASALVGEFRTNKDCVAGGVAAAILTRSGAVYTGICVDTPCSMGFCAEHAAVAEMLKARESEIALVVAVTAEGVIPTMRPLPRADVAGGREESSDGRDHRTIDGSPARRAAATPLVRLRG